jgi:prostaglandin-endoperoxide synthase 2
MRIAVTTHGERIWRALRRTPKVNSAVNRRLINGACTR